jgi:hypothetical protein
VNVLVFVTSSGDIILRCDLGVETFKEIVSVSQDKMHLRGKLTLWCSTYSFG